MSSKYQEAFNYLFGAVHINPSKETYNKNVQIIKELVDKETPIKTVGVSMNGRDYGFCERCGSGIHLAQHYDEKEKKWIKKCYCFHCGQHLDWSDEND